MTTRSSPSEWGRDEDLKSLVGFRDSFFFVGLEHSRARGTLGNAPPVLYHIGPRHHEICKKESNLSLHLGFLGRLRSPRGDICGLSSITWWVTDVAFFSFLSRWGQNPFPTRPLTSDPRIARGGRCQKTKKVLRLHISFAVAKTFFWICADDGEKSCYKVLRPECACHHFDVGSLSL